MVRPIRQAHGPEALDGQAQGPEALDRWYGVKANSTFPPPRFKTSAHARNLEVDWSAAKLARLLHVPGNKRRSFDEMGSRLYLTITWA